MTIPATASSAQSLKHVRLVMGIAAVGMFIGFVVCWLLDMDPTITIALGLLAIVDAAGFAILTLRGHRAPTSPGGAEH